MVLAPSMLTGTGNVSRAETKRVNREVIQGRAVPQVRRKWIGDGVFKEYQGVFLIIFGRHGNAAKI